MSFIYLYIELLSLIFWNFQCIWFFPPCLNLFLNTLFFDDFINILKKSFLCCSLLVCRTTTDFCMLILYPKVLLNLFNNSKFLMKSLGFFPPKIMSSVNRDDLISSFLIWMTFIYFSYLISVNRTSSIMLNRGDESEYPWLVSDLGRKAFSLSSFLKLRMSLLIKILIVKHLQ